MIMSEVANRTHEPGATMIAVVAVDVPSRARIALTGDINGDAEPLLTATVDWLSALAPASVLLDLNAVTSATTTLPTFLARAAHAVPAAKLSVCRLLQASSMTSVMTAHDGTPESDCLPAADDHPSMSQWKIDAWSYAPATGVHELHLDDAGDLVDERDARADARQLSLDERETLLDERQRRLDDDREQHHTQLRAHTARVVTQQHQADKRDADTADRQFLADERERLLDERQQTLTAQTEQTDADARHNAETARRLHAIKDGLDRRVAVAELQEWLTTQPSTQDPNPPPAPT